MNFDKIKNDRSSAVKINKSDPLIKPKTSKTTFGVIWIPTKGRNKYKKEKQFNSVAHRSSDDRHSKPHKKQNHSHRMSGDSPDLFLLEDKNVDSIDKGVNSETVTVYVNADTLEKGPLEGFTEKNAATVVTKASLDIPNEKTALDVQIEKPQEKVTPVSTDDNDILNVLDDADEDDKKNGKEKLKHSEINQSKESQNKTGDKKDEGTQALEKVENSVDKIDSVYLYKSSDEKVQALSNSDKEEDDWGLKCLYFSMQCCECTIM